ncbi:MAG TPA: hypothetical protein VFN85_06065 [Solirubrobacterales bacterium]|nr:hypothetical protein [Solirubrobacterales bacterium]
MGTRRSLFGEGPLEPLSVKLLQAAGVLSLLLVLVVVNSLVNPSGGESPFNPNPVAAAAQRTEEVPGMRMSLTMRFTSESGPPSTITGHGTFNGEDNLAEFTYDGAVAGQRMEFDAVLGEDAWYFRYPQLAGRMPEGKEWLKLEGFPGQKDLSSPGVGNPDESLGMLRAGGRVRRLGHARIGRVETTRYRVTMSPEGIVQALHAQGKDELAEQIEGAQAQIVGPVHAEVFVTPDGMLRRMRTVTTVLAEGKAVTTDMRADLFDFGIHPEIEVPDDSQVLDLGPELEEKLGRLS